MGADRSVCERRMSSREVNNLQMLNRILCKQMILIVYQEVAGGDACMWANGCELDRAESRVCERGTVACVGWAGKTYVRQRDRSLPKLSLEVACSVCDA